MSDRATFWRDSARHLFLDLYGVMTTTTLKAFVAEQSHLPTTGPDLGKHAIDVPYQYRHSLLFSRSASTADDDFFNEPSTMRPQMTAAAAQKDEDSRVQDDASATKGNTYDLTARGTRANYRAAPVA